MILVLQVLACVLAADFLSGLFHWLEDAYGHADWPVLGALVTRKNDLHHREPAYFTRFGYWRSAWLLYVLAGVLALGAWALGVLTWQVWLVLALGVNANQVHKWAHRSRRRNGWLITALMDARVLQSQRHHALHHSGSERTHYCVLTPVLNPVLDGARFWSGLERGIERSLGVVRRQPG